MTIRPLAAALALLAAAPAAGSPLLPGLFDVTGVEANEFLNVRAAPDPASEIVGRLPPYADGIEVVATARDGAWGRVNVGEGSGWVAMRFLAPGTDVWAAPGLPASLRCFGTEPFWSLRPEGEGLAWSTPEATASYVLEATLEAGPARAPLRVAIGRDGDRRVTLVAAPGACSDGMSDRAFGLTADVILEDEDGPALLGGCCSIAP